MVDKIWSDWQNHDPANKNAFSGGITIKLDSTEDYDRYPNGAPPMLKACSLLPSHFVNY